jgi:hypothetical protein
VANLRRPTGGCRGEAGPLSSGALVRLHDVTGDEERPLAEVVLVIGEHEHALGPVEPDGRCDLALVDELLWLQLQARRLGWTVCLRDVAPDLRELFELVGLADRLED